MFILLKSRRPRSLCWCSVTMTQMTCLFRHRSPVSSSPLMQPSVIFLWPRALQSQYRPVTWLEPCCLRQVPCCVEFWVPAPLQMWRQSNSCGSDRLARALTATKSRDSKTSRQTGSSLRAWLALSASLHVSLCLSLLPFTTVYIQIYIHIVKLLKTLICFYCDFLIVLYWDWKAILQFSMFRCFLLILVWNVVAQNWIL